MDDILKSIKAFLYERSVSPLFGAFSLAWAIWNFRVIIIIFSGSDFENKLIAIDNYFSIASISVYQLKVVISGSLIYGLFYPAALTAFYLYAYPLLAEPAYEHHLKKQKIIRKIKQDSENERLLSKSESREIFRKLTQLQNTHDSETETYEQNITSFRDTIKELETQLNSTNTKEKSELTDKLWNERQEKSNLQKNITSQTETIKQLEEISDKHREEVENLKIENQDLRANKNSGEPEHIFDSDLTSNELEQLMQLGDLGGSYDEEELLNQSAFKQIVAQNLLQTLTEKGFIRNTINHNGNSLVQLTASGTEKLLTLKEYSTRKDIVNVKEEIPF